MSTNERSCGLHGFYHFALLFFLLSSSLSFETPLQANQPRQLLESSNPFQNLSLGAIIGICVGAAIVIIVIIVFSCYYYSNRAVIKRNLNQVDEVSTTEEQFQTKKQLIIDSLAKSYHNQSDTLRYYYYKNPNIIKITAPIVEIKRGKFISEIRLQGEDRIGKWEGSGYILCKNSQMYFWMFKDYLDKATAKQLGSFQNLIYESTCFHSKRGINGDWYYLLYRSDSRFVGRWQLSFREVVSQFQLTNRITNGLASNLIGRNSMRNSKRNMRNSKMRNSNMMNNGKDNMRNSNMMNNGKDNMRNSKMRNSKMRNSKMRNSIKKDNENKSNPVVVDMSQKE